MTRRGTLPLSTIIVAVILGVFFILFTLAFLAPKGLVQTIAKNSVGILNYLPGIGQEDLEKVEVESDPKIEAVFEKLVASMQTDAAGPCFIDYGSLPNLEGYKFSFSSSGGKTTGQLTNPKGQIVGSFFAPIDVQLCVVAEGNAASNFYSNWIDCGAGGKACGRNVVPDFASVGSITIPGKEELIYDGKTVDKEDGGLLYIPEKGKVCFFPTFDGDGTCNPSEEGLDDDCVESEEGDWFEEENLPYRLREDENVEFC